MQYEDRGGEGVACPTCLYLDFDPKLDREWLVETCGSVGLDPSPLTFHTMGYVAGGSVQSWARDNV